MIEPPETAETLVLLHDQCEGYKERSVIKLREIETFRKIEKSGRAIDRRSGNNGSVVSARNNKTRKVGEEEEPTTKREVRKEAEQYASPSEKRARKRQRKKKEGRGVSRERVS